MPWASLLCPPWPSPRSFPPPGFCPGLSLCQEPLTCFSCFFPQGSCSPGGGGWEGTGFASGEADPQVPPVLDPFLSQYLSTLRWQAWLPQSLQFQCSSALREGGTGGAYAGSTRHRGRSPFLGLWPSLQPFVKEEEKAQFHIWGVFRCAKPTGETARPRPLALGLGAETHRNASFLKG